MHWNATKEKHGTMRTNTMWLKNTINKGKSGRSLQAIKVYQQWSKEKIEAHVKAEIEEQDAKTQKERMLICCWVVTKLWDQEDEDIMAEIKEETEKQKMKEKIDVSGIGKLGEERTPEEYDK
jgi:hypothetical protein